MLSQLFGGYTASLLEQYGGYGTYFVNGLNSDCIYNQERVEDLRARYHAGHVIGSHLWTRESPASLSVAPAPATARDGLRNGNMSL